MTMDLKLPILREALKLRTSLAQSGMNYLIRKGFLHPPVYMISSITDPLAHNVYPANFSYYGQATKLMQSLIFHKMAIVSTTQIDKVFWLSPNVRLELEKAPRYATEFTQLDFEAYRWTWQKAIEFATDLIVNMLKKTEFSDNEIRRITNIKREAYDRKDEKGNYLNFDLEINGIEVCSGAEREWEYDKILDRMKELNYDLTKMMPILDLAAQEKLQPSAGAGIGIERLTWAILKKKYPESTIDCVYPFARHPQEEIVF